MKVPERRCQTKRTCTYLVERVTARTVCIRQGQTPLLPGVHLRIGTRNKNQIANGKRHQIATDVNFIEKLGAHGFAPIAGLTIYLKYTATDLDLCQYRRFCFHHTATISRRWT